jgi:hypothetical protein
MRNAWLYTLIPLLSHSCLRGPIILLKKIGSHYTLSIISHIIGPSTQGWDRSGRRVYNQAFLLLIMVIDINYQIDFVINLVVNVYN